ncbi:hypothetical protein [Sporomusa acidovorans]|uniref:START domain-containing protein n=1 Tax=Sporomusa acidovorans (strain ATCC 49682 / DSM 3132 / Mol) TaxID=1123286 RepID=A0ABZ3IVT7_SPOA4|nr:hypothetical protein [Sporomusa acidovorans]OZC23891.1 hypothetical protein SPACI_04080 [Sporomusa acidovorans DSM 3132]SDF54204.1 hypothetical protein SAMN04488499_10578 [Sporomusa acidovorans]
MQKILLYCLVILSLLTSVAAAQERKDEWQDKKADFRQYKTIVIDSAIEKSLPLEEIDHKKLEILLGTSLWREKLGNIHWLTESQLEKEVGTLAQTDLNALKTSNPEAYTALMAEYTPKIADGRLAVEVRQWGYSQRYIPAGWENYTEYRSTPVKTIDYDDKGRPITRIQWVTVPVEESRLVPAHYDQIAQAGLAFTLTNSKTGDKVWMLLDLRDAEGSKVPAEMTERIIKRAAGRLAAFLK